MQLEPRQSATLDAAARAEVRAFQSLQWLAARMARKAADRPYVSWVSGNDDPGDDYCVDCAAAVVAEIGGEVHCSCDEGHGSAFPAACGRCGAQLSYSLTEHGLKDEIQEIEERDLPLPLAPDRAYEIENVIATALSMILHGDEDAEAIGRRAMKAAERAMGITAWEAMRL